MTTHGNGPVPAEELLMLIERWERLQGEKEAIGADQKDVMGEAKARGYDTRAMREIIKLRKLEPHVRREREAIVDTYRAALGMLDGTPLGKWAVERLSKQPEPSPEEEQYRAAVRLVVDNQKASPSWLQRELKIGNAVAAALIERMEREGIVSAPNKARRRDVLKKPDDLDPSAGGAGEEVQAGEVAATESVEPAEPPLTVDDAHRMGTEAAKAGAPVTSNPFPAFDDRRAAWDESWCAELGSDGMDIPDALKPTPKPKKAPDPAPGGDA